jgi:hypothetical protein
VYLPYMSERQRSHGRRQARPKGAAHSPVCGLARV